MPVPWMTLGPLLELDAISSSQVLPYRRTGFRQLSENTIIYEEIFVSYCISVWKKHIFKTIDIQVDTFTSKHTTLWNQMPKYWFSEMQNFVF